MNVPCRVGMKVRGSSRGRVYIDRAEDALRVGELNAFFEKWVLPTKI